MAATVPKSGCFRVGGPVLESAAGQNLGWRQLLRGRGLLPLVLRIQRASGPFSSRNHRLSVVASLAILALVLDWLAEVLEWSTRRLVEFQDNGVTFYRLSPGDSSFPAWLSHLALAIFVSAGVLSALQSRRPRLPRLIPFFLGTMLAYGAFWVIVGFEPAEYRYAFGTAGPLLFVMCLGVYAGLDLTLWHRLRPIVLALAYCSVTLGAYYTVRLSVMGTFKGPTPMNQHLQTAFWFAFAALVIGRSSGWKSHLVALIPIALCVPIAILMASRSWTLLTTLALGLGLKIAFQERFRVTPAKTLALGLLSITILGAGMWLLSRALPERVEALENRLLEDTRSGQYSQFFQQIPATSLIAGLGPKATYAYNDWDNYDYIDNQFLFILFKFGLPVLLGYCAVVLWPGLRLLIGARTQQERLPGVFIAFWTLASLGVSVFHGITNNPQNLIAILLAGRCFLFMTGSSHTRVSEVWPQKCIRGNVYRMK